MAPMSNSSQHMSIVHRARFNREQRLKADQKPEDSHFLANTMTSSSPTSSWQSQMERCLHGRRGGRSHPKFNTRCVPRCLTVFQSRRVNMHSTQSTVALEKSETSPKSNVHPRPRATKKKRIRQPEHDEILFFHKMIIRWPRKAGAEAADLVSSALRLSTRD